MLGHTRSRSGGRPAPERSRLLLGWEGQRLRGMRLGDMDVVTTANIGSATSVSWRGDAKNGRHHLEVTPLDGKCVGLVLHGPFHQRTGELPVSRELLDGGGATGVWQWRCSGRSPTVPSTGTDFSARMWCPIKVKKPSTLPSTPSQPSVSTLTQQPGGFMTSTAGNRLRLGPPSPRPAEIRC